ncbi:Protein detoxification 34 [Vitis vinifera]|uniref:Protein detoxification 34 n=1 Tax=Vitis vinifera TaxID=29760 RepID=A0A438E2T0_VITVI|nr:Protein detoxification 34 [Vitis vinifera]
MLTSRLPSRLQSKIGSEGTLGGMVCGTALQTLILLFIVYRTNWNKEVSSSAWPLVEQRTERMLKWEGQHIETEKTSDDLDFELTFFVDEHCINVGFVPNRSQVDYLPCLCFLKSPSNYPGVRWTSPLYKRMFGPVIRVYPSKA